MDISAQLLKEHSKNNGMLVAKYVTENSINIDLLIALSSTEVVYQQRSSQALAYAVEHFKIRLNEYQMKELINLLKIEGIHDAVHRNVLKIIDIQVVIPSSTEGFLFDYCTSNIMNPQKAIAIRAFSVPVAYRIALPYVELQNELCQILQGLSPLEGPGMMFRKKKYLQLLENEPSDTQL